MQIGRVEAGATAPTATWPILVAETSQDSWEEYGAINAMGSQQCWTSRGHGRVSGDFPDCKCKGKGNLGKGKGKGNLGKGKGAYEWSKSNYDGNKGTNYGMYKGGWKANRPSSYGPVKGYQKSDGKSGWKGDRYGKCCTCGGDHFARDCTKVGRKGGFRALEAWDTWEEPPLAEHARVLSSLRQAPPKHAGPQRVPRELRKKFITCADMNCNCKGGHQRIEGEVLAPPGLQAKGQDGEWEAKVSKKNPKSQKQGRTGRTDASTGFTDYTSGSQRRRRLGRD